MLAKSVDDLEVYKLALDCKYIKQTLKEELVGEYKHVSGMLNKMMDNPDSWCRHYIDKK